MVPFNPPKNTNNTVQAVQHIYVDKSDARISYIENEISYKKSSVFWDIVPCNQNPRDVPEEHVASIFKVEE
jgi:hypothetical protein